MAVAPMLWVIFMPRASSHSPASSSTKAAVGGIRFRREWRLAFIETLRANLELLYALMRFRSRARGAHATRARRCFHRSGFTNGWFIHSNLPILRVGASYPHLGL